MSAEPTANKPTPKGHAVRWSEADLYEMVYPSPAVLRQAARYWRTHAPDRMKRLLEAKRE